MVKKAMNALAGALIGGAVALAFLAWAPTQGGASVNEPCPTPSYCGSPYSCVLDSGVHTYCYFDPSYQDCTTVNQLPGC